MKHLITIGAALSLGALALSQPAAGVKPASPLADHPAAGLVGEWHGTVSAIGRDGQWHESQAIERVRWNLAGTAILLEGYGYVDDGAERRVGHDAFGLIEYDPGADEVHFYAHRVGGDFSMHTLERTEAGALRWSLNDATRFIITLTDDHWQEVGEMSRDGGATWTKFLETNLDRTAK